MAKGGMEYKSQVKEAWKVIKKSERRGLAAVGKFIRSDARQRLKANWNTNTKNLFKSIHHKVNIKKNKVTIGLRSGSGQKYDGFYGFFLEKGTSNIQAQPFLTPAAENNQDQVREVFGQTVKESMEKEKLKNL